MCKLDENSSGKIITPVEFTVNNVRFVRRTIKLGGVSTNAYCTILYAGQTQLLMTMSRFLNTGQPSDGYAKEIVFNGVYRTKTSYYVQKGNARPELISLSKNALLATLYEQADKLTQRLPNEKLTTDDVIETLRNYDSLMLASAANKPALSSDALFNQELRNRIQYPALAWREGIYGRVYAGFEINPQGQITNVTILSPDNGGFGFEQEVKQALKRLPILKPDFAGTYALPIAFVFASQAGTQEPVNILPTERLGERIVLEEIKIPFSVSKAVASSREIWGYYK